jgi:DNA-binding NarL/FixJ family response regulator
MVEMHRVVLAHDSRLLRGMLRHVIDKAPGLEVVEEISDLRLLLSTVEKQHPHWAIVSLSRDGHVPEIADRVLDTCASVSILAVTIDGTLAKIKRVASREEILGHLSLQELISVLVENGLESGGKADPRARDGEG